MPQSMISFQKKWYVNDYHNDPPPPYSPPTSFVNDYHNGPPPPYSPPSSSVNDDHNGPPPPYSPSHRIDYIEKIKKIREIQIQQEIDEIVRSFIDSGI